MAETVCVTIDGMPVVVPAYTTVAAACAMHGLPATRRSVTGTARAALCGMGICQECRVSVNGRMHTPGCQTLCRDGLVIETSR